MQEHYVAECGCGKHIRVELFEAGTKKACPACKAALTVPSLSKLKELSGDRYPLLSPIEKIQCTLQNAEPPFDGQCHVCKTARRATYQVPITFRVMIERQVEDDGGIRPSLSGGIAFHVAACEERWQETRFPLLFCNQCHAQFQSSHSWAKAKQFIKTLCLIACLGVFLFFIYLDAAAVAALSGITWVIGAIAWAAKFYDTKRIDPFILHWLSYVRWAPEAIATESEFNLSIGSSQPIGQEKRPS